MLALTPTWAQHPPEIPALEVLKRRDNGKARNRLLKATLVLAGYGAVCFCFTKLLLFYIGSWEQFLNVLFNRETWMLAVIAIFASAILAILAGPTLGDFGKAFVRFRDVHNATGENQREYEVDCATRQLHRFEADRARLLAILDNIKSNRPILLEDWRFVFAHACRECGGLEFFEAEALEQEGGSSQFPVEGHWSTHRFCCRCDEVRKSNCNDSLGEVRRVVDRRSPYLTSEEITALNVNLEGIVILIAAKAV
jgi:hypothetical protein